MRKKPAKRAHPYGPAMTALRPMQQRFVEAWIENPGFRPTQLLRLAVKMMNSKVTLKNETDENRVRALLVQRGYRLMHRATASIG